MTCISLKQYDYIILYIYTLIHCTCGICNLCPYEKAMGKKCKFRIFILVIGASDHRRSGWYLAWLTGLPQVFKSMRSWIKVFWVLPSPQISSDILRSQPDLNSGDTGEKIITLTSYKSNKIQ